jgi:predicted small secreted protein
MTVNLGEGTRRLALLLGAAGAILGCLASYLELKSVLNQSARHSRFEQLAASDVVVQQRKSLAGWVSIDPKTGERIQWEQRVNKGGIKTIHWTKDNGIESIETEDEQTLFPTPEPAAWEYLLVALFPVLGFFVPWGTLCAADWARAGFIRGSTPDNNHEIPFTAELQAHFEASWKEAFEQHTDEVRRTIQIRTGFYEKLVTLDTASIAIAASVSVAMITKGVTPNPALSSVSHWLVWIIFLLWVSLISGVAHNFVVVGIAQLEAAHSNLGFIRKLMRESLTFATKIYPEVDRSVIEQVLTIAEKKPQAIQRRNVKITNALQKLAPILGYISMAGFLVAYTLVAICTRRLWL